MADKMEIESTAESLLSDAREITDSKPAEAITLFRKIIFESDPSTDIAFIEPAILELGKLLAKQGEAQKVADLLPDLRPLFAKIPKAKTAKLVRALIDSLQSVSETSELQIKLCKESIDWCKEEKRTFLRQRIETRLATLYTKANNLTEALAVINPLLKEVKKLDDKQLLVEIQLLESFVQHKLKNVPKARAALTAARTAANAIYCPPLLQCKIDMQSGTLHCEEKDFKTAYSYFFEAFEGYNLLENKKAVLALKYMLLCKVMVGRPDDAISILSGKVALKYAGRSVEAMRAVAKAHKQRSLRNFKNALENFATELSNDPLILNRVNDLYDTMLQQNLCRIIEPFSRVEISHVAKLINLDVNIVEQKLSQMILDKKFDGILDQGNGCLILFTEAEADETYTSSLETIENMSKVVGSLYEKATKSLS